MLSEAVSIARSRQSSALDPSFSNTCQSSASAEPTAFQISVSAGGDVYSGGNSSGLSEEHPTISRTGKTKACSHCGSEVRELIILILKSISLSPVPIRVSERLLWVAISSGRRYLILMRFDGQRFNHFIKPWAEMILAGLPALEKPYVLLEYLGHIVATS